MITIDKCKLIQLKDMGDDRGKLAVVEGGIGVPFDINRIFYIFDADNKSVRGRHANRKSEFVLICVHGAVKVRVTDGAHEKVYELNNPLEGLYIPQMIWKDMYDFSDGAVLMVLASTHYDGGEYIRDFSGYRSEVI